MNEKEYFENEQMFLCLSLFENGTLSGCVAMMHSNEAQSHWIVFIHNPYQ